MYNSFNLKPSLIQKITMLVMVLYPVLNIYGFSNGWTINTCIIFILFVCFFPLYFCKRKKTLSLTPKALLIYFIYWYLVSFVSNFGGGIFSMFSFTILLVFLTFVLYWETFDVKWFMKIYQIIALFAVAFFFYQFFTKLTIGYTVSGVIPGLPISKGVSENIVDKSVFGERCFSFFSEPSHLAQFSFPLLYYYLFGQYKNRTKGLIFSVLLVLMLLFLKSGTAFVGFIPIVLGLFLFYKEKFLENRLMIFVVLFIIFSILFCALFFFVESEFGEFVLGRQDELKADNMVASSGFIRIWRGYYIFNDYSIIEKIFGNSNKSDLINYIYAANLDFGMEDFSLTYFNGIQCLLLRTGFIGTAIFGALLLNLWSRNTIYGKCILLAMVLLMFIEAILFTSVMWMYLFLAYTQKYYKQV